MPGTVFQAGGVTKNKSEALPALREPGVQQKIQTVTNNYNYCLQSPSGFLAGFWTFETSSGLGVVLGQTP